MFLDHEKENDAFDPVGQAVIHDTYGKGVVRELTQNGTVVVEFEQHNSVFMYPEVCERFITFENAEYQRHASELICKHGKRKGLSGLRYDPIEDSEEYLAIKDELEALIKAEIGERKHIGYCYLYWGAKRRILKEKYGIEWRSPSELNAGVYFD